MNWKEFIIEFLKICSADVICGLIMYIGYKYIDMKYFSELEISTLLEENKFLKNENRKVNGTSEFWKDEDL